ncbi:MAG: hypothetical protein FWG62_06405 [Proteobacteria bacterium]|nr:hypothetical protein [Pseudomonadota bacterium]
MHVKPGDETNLAAKRQEKSMDMKRVIKKMLFCGAAAMVTLPGFGFAEEYVAPKDQQATIQQEASAPQQEGAPQRESKWSEAGREVKQATGSVVEATKETTGAAWETVKNESSSAWEKTKSGSRELYDTVGDKSKEAWHATKEESKSIWERGKSLVHEATAPNPPVAPPAGAAPPATPPAGQ